MSDDELTGGLFVDNQPLFPFMIAVDSACSDLFFFFIYLNHTLLCCGICDPHRPVKEDQ